jgi:hypothetical protein
LIENSFGGLIHFLLHSKNHYCIFALMTLGYFSLLFFLPISIPIILHFWGITISNKVYIGNVALLKDVVLVTSSSNKLKKLVLLMTRLCFILSLIIAFVFLIKEVVLSNTTTLLPASEILLDKSPSVCSQKQRKQYIEASQLIDHKNSAKKGHSECQNKSENLFQFLATNKSENVTVFSDFQKSFLDLRKNLNSDKKKIRLVGLETNLEEPNMSIDSVWVESNFIKLNTPVNINVWVRNNGNVENKNVLIELRTGEKSVASKLESILPNSRKKLKFSTIVSNDMAELCEIRIDDASWTFDNNFVFVLKPTKDLPILVISENNPNKNPFKLAYDLEPVFNCKTSATFNNSSFDANSLIVFNQSENVSRANFEALINYSKKGGTVLIVPSEKWTSKETAALNNAIGKRVVENIESAAAEIKIPDLQNPFFQNIFETKPTVGMMPTVKPVLKLDVGSEPILSINNGAAALASIELGSGNVYIASFTLGETETFSRNSIFLPILYRIAEKSFKNTSKPYYRISDEVIDFVPIVNVKNKEEVFSIENGEFKIIPDQRFIGNSVKLFLPNDDIPLGIWTVKNKDGAALLQFGLNNDKQESIVDFYSVDELKDKFKMNKNVEVMSFNQFKNERKLLTDKSDSWPNWWYAIVISFLFLLAEILVVRFYKHSTLRPSKV